MRVIITFILLSFAWTSTAQKELFFQQMDSIRMEYRSEGKPLDSIDGIFLTQPNLRPGAGFGQTQEASLAENLFSNNAGFAYLNPKSKVTPKFSGIPYLGFQYAFGSKLTQDLNVEYQQFYQPNTHLHFRYNRKSGNGFLRNSDYKLNDVHLRFYHQKSWYATNFEGFYGAYNLSQNRGIATDTLLDEFAIEFTPVRQDNSASKMRTLDLKWDNFFKLFGSDSTASFGLKSRHQFELVNREFSEFLIDPTIVDTFYLDTSGQTRDQFQTAKLSNGAGVYFSSKFFKVDASINHQYWKNQNSGVTRGDTNEIFIHSNLWTALGERISLHNEFYFNLIGATGEIREYAQLKFKVLDNLGVHAKLNFENLYPTPYQRFHSANYYQWKIDNLKMQQKLQIIGGIKYGKKNFVQADLIWTNINNGRYFINNEWRQDTLEFVSVGALNVKGAYHIKKFSFYPSATLRFNSANFNYQPVFSTLNRIAFTTQLFKAQKLGMSLGVDVGYETSYNHMMYNGVLDLYELALIPEQTKDLLKLNAFLALSIDEFRFFVRAENLSSLFQDAKIRIDYNYPMMPFLLRVGITWDFFN